MYVSFIWDLLDRERRDLLDNCFELELMKLFVPIVSKLLSSILLPLVFVANDTSEGVASMA